MTIFFLSHRIVTFNTFVRAFPRPILASMLIYPLARLRQLAKDNVIRPPEKILDLPITAIHAVELVEENATEIAREMGDESTEMLKSAMTMMHQRYQAIKVEENKNKGFFSFLAQSPPAAPSVPPSAMLVAFGDNNATNELVYGVAIDRFVRPYCFICRYSVH